MWPSTAVPSLSVIGITTRRKPRRIISGRREAAEKEVVHRYDEKPCLRDREVSYRFLTGGASYDAMAVAYREYLQSRDLLPGKSGHPSNASGYFYGGEGSGVPMG